MKKTNNNKKINKNLTVRRNIITISASFALMIVALVATIFVLNFKGYEKKFMAYDGYYDSQQVPDLINTTGKPTQLYQKMSELYDHNTFARNETTIGNYSYISIETKDDFYAFTRLCTTNDFKTKKFILLKDIDWSSTDQQRLVTPISSFAGELNGNGYAVKNLSLAPINQDKLSDNYALFKELAAGGKILNLGLVDTTMSINASPDSGKNIYLANLCAVNKGIIDHVYVKDRLDEKTSKGYNGMEVIISGFYISGVVAKNEGTFTNSYYAGKSIIKTEAILTMTPNAIQEMLLENTGTQSNLYYYNESIESYTVNGSNISVKYSGVSQIYDYTSSSPRYGTYCKNLKDSSETEYGLGEEVTSFSGSNWINESYYEHSNFGALIDFTTPLYKKIDDSNVSLTDGVHTVKITSTEDFNYIFNQMLLNDKFTDKSMVYQLECDINVDDMANISYDDSIQSKFTVAQSSEENAPVSYHTIYMSKYYNVFPTDTGYKSYGFFPFFAGELSYINFVLDNNGSAVAIADTDATTKAIGSAIGYAEEAIIDHVNAYINVSFDNAIGKYLAGGIAGVIAGRTTISNSTANGTITSTDNSRQSFNETAQNVDGVAIGGCVGYIGKTGASVDTLLSNVTITSQGYTGKNVNIGGVVAAGYFINSTKLQNNGSITIAKGSENTTASAYGTLYAAGVVGRFLGMYYEATLFTNNGDMTLYQASGSPTYYAGILNADIQKTNVGSYVLQSKGNNQFWAAAMTNGANINIYSANSSTIMYTYGINIKNSSQFVTTLSGIYNLNYKFANPSTALGTINIDMNIIKKFAPVIMSDNTGNSVYNISISTVYNLRNIEYKLNTAISAGTTFDYTGVVYGSYVNYTNVRNEGNQTITLGKGISTASTLYVSGVFKSLSNGCKATSIYNGGDILISEPNGSNAVKKLDMYLSGICYQNESVDSNVKQNPLSTTFDKSLVGTLNNTINSGNITIDSYYHNDTTKTTKINETPGTKPYYNSNIYIGGITNINKGIISNTFNLGDVNVPIYSFEAGKHYEAGGIAYMMDGENAQIRDSANNGDITIIDTLNMSSKSYVNIGGIVARNTSTNSNNKQIISFTINYGTLFAFQPANNMSNPTAGNAHATCGGIIGIGVCNLVNVLNYGTVYSNECAAGIVSIVNLQTFSNANTINFANTINYGVVKINPQYYATDQQALNYQTYNTILSKQYVENGDPSIKKTYSGAICTIFDFNSQTNINIRYLINLCNDATTIMTSLRNPTTAIDTSTFITTHGAADYFGTQLIKYAPLSTLNDGENIGVFNENFIFYKAINGEGLDTEHYVTDLYISDFFEFVKFDKINPVLLDKIGWRTIAYANAAENLFKNVNALKSLVSLARDDYSYNNTGITNLLSDAFTSDTWIESMDIDLLNSLLEEVFKSGNTDGISTYKAVLKYVLLDSSANSAYTQQIRTTVVNKIMDYYAEDANINYYELLQTLLYDELLAKVVSKNNADYAEILRTIRETLEDCEDLSTIFDAYITVLQTNPNLLDDLFTKNNTAPYYLDSKIELLQTLLNGYDQLTLEELYNKLKTGELDPTVNYKLYLQENPTQAKNVYIGLITNNSFSDTLGSTYLSWINEYTNKYNLTTVLNEEKTTDSSFSNMEDNFGNISDLSGYKYHYLNGNQGDTTQDSVTIESQRKDILEFEPNINATSLFDENDSTTIIKDYSALWNVIKNNSVIQEYISNNYFEEITDPTSGEKYRGIYALATEWNNTYQANERSQLQYNIPITYHGGISNGGSTGGDYYGNSVFATYDGVTTNNMPIKNRFIYVPDEVVSYQTNYYGPFIAARGTNKGVVYSADGHLLEGNANYNKGVAANAAIAVTTGSPKRNMIPVFIGLDNDFVVQKIVESKTSANNYNTYIFHWNDSQNRTSGTKTDSDYMWKSISFISNKGVEQDPAKNSYGYIYYLYDGNDKASNPSNYIQYGYDFNPNRYTDATKYINKTNDNKTVTLPGGTTTSGINDTYFRHTYSDYYLKGYVTTSIITGVFMTHSTWPANNTNHISLHSKNETAYAFGDNDGYYGVHTTSYTGYRISDLVKLDGVRTKGHCKDDENNLDEDEINIISAICTKLLQTAAGKEKVLYAIADYAKDNNFKASDTAVVRMLLSAVQDTNFAKEITTNGINGILSLKYSSDQTIREYLNQYANNLTDFKDLIISKSVNNNINFRTVLLETLNNYAVKSKLYNAYYSYTRDAVTQYVYNYVKYKYDNGELDWTDFDSALQSVSDNDLTYLVNLFDVSTSEATLNNYTYQGDSINFIIDDAQLINSESSNFSNYYSGYDYNRVLLGKTNYNSGTGTGSNIQFTTGNYTAGYDLQVTYEGTLTLVGNNTTQTQTFTHTANEETTTYTFSGLAANTTYKLYFNQNTEIYDVVTVLSSAYTGQGTVNYTTAKTPFASFVNSTQVQHGNTLTLHTNNENKQRYYGAILKGAVNLNTLGFDAIANFTIANGQNITYNSIDISYKVLIYNNTDEFDAILRFNNNVITTTRTSLSSVIINEGGGVDRTYLQYMYTASISRSSINSNNTFTIEAIVDGGEKYNNQWGSNIILGDIYVDYDFNFANSPNGIESNCLFHQNVLAPYLDNTNNANLKTSGYNIIYRSTITVTNSNENVGVTLSGGTTGSIDFTSTNNRLYVEAIAQRKMDSAITFTPRYYDASYAQGEIFSEAMYLNNIPIENHTIVNNLNNYYNLLSDVGKYVIKDYFVEQKNQNSINTSFLNSYIEFYAKGNGQIKVYAYNDEHENLSEYLSDTPYQTINVNSSNYQFYEIVGNSDYVYLFTTLFTTNGSLYTYDSANSAYVPVTSGSYNSATTYYIKGKSSYIEVLVEDKVLYTTNGTLYTYDSINDVYNAVTSGAYDSTVTYYVYDGESYIIANVTDQNVLVDSVYVTPVGGMITKSGTTTNTVRYSYNGKNTILLKFDYSAIATLDITNSHLSEYNTDFGVNYEKYQLFYTIYPYYRYVDGMTNEELNNKDIFETLITLMATIKQDSINTNYFTLFADSCFTDEKLIELIKLIALADYKGNDSSLDKLISTTYFNNYCDDLLNYLCDDVTGILEIKINAAKYIWNQANSDHSSALADYIYGVYLGDDYLTKSNLKTESLMYTLLNNFTVGEKDKNYYQFITSNSTVDAAKVAELIELLTSSSDFELGGYGIYALASSQGKLNGQFIPDNLELDTLDPYYAYVSESIGYALVSATSTSSATWRGGSSGNEDDTTDSNSVNHAFYIEMRQLIKSISTTVFELTLVDNASGTVEYYGDVNLDARTVTFYVADTSDVFGSYKVSNIDLAYHAEAYDGALSKYADDMTKFGVGTVINVSNPDVVSRQFTVFAEDTTVHKTYSIIFKVLKPSFDLVYKGATGDAAKTKTVGSAQTNTTVELSLTSKALNPNPSNYTDYLPIGLNLKPYIRLDKMDGTVVDTLYMDSEFIDLSTRSGDHIVKPVIVSHVITGSQATITMEISYKIPAGEYRITVSVCGYTDYVTYIKEASSQYTIEAHFGDSTTNIFASSKTATSYVQFGRLYNNIELTDFNDNYDDTQYGEFYLSYFSYSANATVKSTATKEVVPVYDTLMIDGTATQVLLYNKYRYTITYVIEAEDIAINTGHKATYIHYVEELDPYANNTQFGDVSKDGTEVNPGSPLYDQDAALDDNRVVSVKYQVGQLRTNNGNPVYKTEISKARVQFNRSEENGDLNEPRYSITYNMNNIYTISPNATLTPVEITADETIKGSATVKSRFGGMSIKLSYLTDTGIYEFKYVYANKGVWYTLDENNNLTYDEDNVVVSEEYTSTYDFPALQISKLFSLDATIHSITFMDAFQGTSAASTGVRIHAMRPTGDNLDTDTGEMVYSDILDDTEGLYNDIAVQPNGDIVYNQKGTDYATVQYYDYYIVGAVSNAQLSNYAPTFTIEDHALIFQYITARISNNYGDGKQGELSDAAVLEDHSTTTYLYVPFTHVVVANDTQTIVNDVFLVQLNGKRLTKVYIAKGFTTSSTSIATINVTINDAKNTGASFTYAGVTYTLNKAVFGEENNNYSLYMDYIGSPLNDHFWYVNYVVFSENYVRGSESIYLKYYHIAIIDRSNNVYFDVLVIVPVDFDISKYDTLYLLFQGTYKDGTVNPAIYAELAVGAYVYEPEDYVLNGVAKKAYVLRYNIQMLPSAYYYFNIDLPVGYQAEATVTNKTNFNAVDDYLGGNTGQMNYEGAYLPPSSIVAQVVQVTINVTPGETGETNVWGITNSDVYTRRATLDNDRIVGN